jgi:uncharacterized membrane protein YjgN (DUF898 family)
MSFGPLEFQVNLDAEGLKWRWALIFAVPTLLILFAFAAGISFLSTGAAEPEGWRIMTFALLIVAAIYIGIPLATLHWYAKFFRMAADATSLGELEFGFDASTWDWLKLFLGNLALAVVTLGFGLTYWGYRNWSFMVRHMQVFGTIDISALTQSTTAAPVEAEGFADAFDVGAI